MAVTLNDILNTDRPETVQVLGDGDIYAHRAASVTDGKMYGVNDPDHKNAIFRYKKDVDAYCAKHGIAAEHISVQYFPEPWNRCRASLEMMYRSIRISLMVRGNDLPMTNYISGKLNFRTKILRHYKWNRLGVPEVVRRCGGNEERARAILRMKPATFEKHRNEPPRKPHHLADAKKWIMKEQNGVQRDWFEADDLIGMEAMRCREEGMPYIIVTIDKDLDCIPGPHFNTNKDEYYIVSPEEAVRNFYRQCLFGDNTDNIPGAPGLGGKGALNLISKWETSEEEKLFQLVFDTWVEKTWKKEKKGSKTDPEVIYDRLLRSGQCLWIAQNHKAKIWEDALWVPPKDMKETIRESSIIQ